MNLLIYNLKVDSNDDVLGFTTYWINGLAKNFDNVYVITMYLGKLAVSENVTVYSLGQEKEFSKLMRLFNFYKIFFFVISTKQINVCLSHMNQLFVVLSAPFLRLKRIPIVLWYAHGHVSVLLKIAHYFSNLIVSSSASGFRLKTNKLKIVGQGIDTHRFRPCISKSNEGVYRILSVGRISSIKRLELLLHAVADLSSHTEDGRRIEVVFTGRPLTQLDYEYKEYLKVLARNLGIEKIVKFSDSLPFHLIDRVYKNADLFVNTSGTGSMDKTILEAMASGLPVITSNIAFRELLKDFQDLCFIDCDDVLSLKLKISYHLEMDYFQKIALGKGLRRIVKKDHSFDGLCRKITTILKGF